MGLLDNQTALQWYTSLPKGDYQFTTMDNIISAFMIAYVGEDKIISKVKPEQILWEAPAKKQQVWFINLFGTKVNLGNIAPNEVIPLETLRLGLRGDTFFNFLPEKIIVETKPVVEEKKSK